MSETSSAAKVDEAALAEMMDKQAIAEVVRLERFWRDSAQWDRLADAYTEDSHVRTTWFDGTGKDFAAASKDMAVRGRVSSHPINPVHIRVNGDRALCESIAEIRNRSVIEGIEVDMVQYCRFFSRLRRTEQGWKLASFDGIYGKDAIAPTNPKDELPFDFEELKKLRPSYRVWAYTIGLRGYDVGQEELGDDRPDLLEPFYAAADRWLATGE